MTSYLAYVASESADEVSLLRFDGSQVTVARVIPVGRLPNENDGPHGLSVTPDGRYWLVSLAHGTPAGWLQKFATGADTIVGAVELGMFSSSLAATPDGVFANFHGDMVASTVSAVHLASMAEVARISTCTMPHGARVSNDGRLVYTACMMDDQLVEIDAYRLAVSRRVTLGPGPVGPTSCSPTWAQPLAGRAAVLVACNRARAVLVVDPAAGTITRRVETPEGPYNLDLTPDGTRLLVTQKGAGSVTIWDLRSWTMLAELRTGRPLAHGVAVTSDGRYAFVTAEGRSGQAGSVDVVDLDRLEIVAHADVGKQAAGVAFWRIEAPN
jgi:DNA-binding beta-propeller fold protein YncE